MSELCSTGPESWLFRCRGKRDFVFLDSRALGNGENKTTDCVGQAVRNAAQVSYQAPSPGIRFVRTVESVAKEATVQEGEGQQAKVMRRKSPTGRNQECADSRTAGDDCEDVVLLKKEISRLEAENKKLRKQIAKLTNSGNPPVPSGSDSVREQRHNFFKYSNIRRY